MSSEPHNTFGTIGAYRLLTRLGKGGMGEVFRAYDQRLKRDVAIKRIRAERSFDQSARSRFRREAQAVARLSHPSIVPIFDVLDTEEGDCIVMEYVEGQSLAAFMEAGPIPVRTAVQIAGAIASGLGHAHDKGLIHRDLKPENVMLTKAPDGFGSTHQAKILDFGLARALASRPVEDLEAPLTEPGAVIGTVHAMSPEQAMGEEVDHRTDLFSLGALLYEMLTATSAFRGKNWIDTLNRVIHEDPAALDAQALGIPEELAELTMSLMAKKSAERPPSAGRVAAQLRKIDLRLAAESGGFQSLQTPAVGGSAGAAKDAPSTVAAAQVRTLVLVQLLDAARIAVSADTGGSNVLSRHDRDARNLATQLRGFEVEHADGFLAIFERPIDGVHFAIEYHRLVSELGDEIEEP
ncbi:MAG: protein kinase, partial [Acidobacteriota bacterium]